MLLELSIKDFAIIDSLTISFGPGLNIFTGETGAGKSIIMDAISLILGDRASSDIIRASCEEAQVQALFDISGLKSGTLRDLLKESGAEASSDDLIIKRIVQRAGRNRIYINGSLATLVTLTEVGRRLIDIYGQSEHQSLTRPEEHIEVLDSYGGFQNLRAYMAGACREYLSLKRDRDALLQDSRSFAEKRDLLGFQLKEITDAGLKPGEDTELKKDKERLQGSGKIRAITEEAERTVYSDAGSITERLGTVVRALKEAALLDDRLRKTTETLEASLFELEDAGSFLRDYTDSIEADPEALEAISERLDLIHKLRKKHGDTIEAILLKKGSLEKELSNLENSDFRLGELEARVKTAGEKAQTAAVNLSDARKAAAKELEARIEEELSSLGMGGTLFETSIEEEWNPDGSLRFSERGADRVSFFIATNKGEGLKPLAKVASGGELSRIMLAMKSVIASGRVPTLIFDEIDTGVSGAMAQVVGLKLKEVSRSNQVLCITHLPQVAAFGDRHFSVAKKSAGGRTMTTVEEVSGDERVAHISAMLGGLTVTETTRKHASELLEAAQKLSKKKAAAAGRRKDLAEDKS